MYLPTTRKPPTCRIDTPMPPPEKFNYVSEIQPRSLGKEMKKREEK
jgi:hypothetical protein